MDQRDPNSTIPPAAADIFATRPLSPSDHPATVANPAECRAIGNYVVERELGRGGMGVVYLARHSQFSDRRYAVKLIAATIACPITYDRFRREVEAVGKSRHTNLLYAIDAGSHEGSPYLVTEFVDGLDLGRILRDRGPLPVPVACEIARQMASGLAFAHAHGIIHRDIKPQNVMLQPNGLVKILDLGLASVRDSTLGPPAGEVVGTPAYMPPEQWRAASQITTAADIYSLGCTLFEMLAGRPPYPPDRYPGIGEQQHAHLHLAPPRIGDVAPRTPADIARLVDRCLEKDPTKRPRGCDEIVSALEAHAAPIESALVLGDANPSGTGDAAARYEQFVSEYGDHRGDASSAPAFVAAWLAGLLIAASGLTMAYFGPGTTPAWSTRFDLLADMAAPAGTGFLVEQGRSVLFLTLIFLVAFLRYRMPITRFFTVRLHTWRVWVARLVFFAVMSVFLGSEFCRHWYPQHAATDMVAWAASHGIVTTADREVVPYRWYLAYSLVHYTCVFGGLLLLPVLQFTLADAEYVRRSMKLFTAAQREEPNAMESVNRLYGLARQFRRVASRYVDVAGTLAVGIQYEYWIGRWTLTATGYLIEVAGMVLTAAVMVAFFAYVTAHYADAIDITLMRQGGGPDYRIEDRLERFNLQWFLRSAVLSRPGGVALISLMFLALVVGRRAFP